jgi:hypothetical protein
LVFLVVSFLLAFQPISYIKNGTKSHFELEYSSRNKDQNYRIGQLKPAVNHLQLFRLLLSLLLPAAASPTKCGQEEAGRDKYLSEFCSSSGKLLRCNSEDGTDSRASTGTFSEAGIGSAADFGQKRNTGSFLIRSQLYPKMFKTTEENAARESPVFGVLTGALNG